MKYSLSGQTLLSLMLSLALSSFLLIAILAFYNHIQKQNNEIYSRLFLQSEIERVLQLLKKDLRRAGFRASVEKLQTSNLAFFEQDEEGTSVTITQKLGEAENSCILFFYDLDQSGCIGSTYTKGICAQQGRNLVKEIERELFGYRLHKKMIETRLTYKNAVEQNCSQEQCRSYIQQSACEKGGWVDLLDSKKIEISHFSFEWLKPGNMVETRVTGYLVAQPHIQYRSHVVIPLLNQKEWK